MNIESILTRMMEEDVDTSLFLKKENINYVTGFNPSSFAVLLLKEDPKIFVSKMDLEEANKFSKIDVEVFKSFDDLKDILKNSGSKKLGLEGSLPLSIYEKIKGDWELAISDILSQFRRIKTSDEIDKIKKAILIAEKSLKELDYSGTEKEVAAKLEYSMKINGSQKEAFETIVASGPRSSLPHAYPSSNTLESPLMIDWGAVWKNYCSDCTRTIVQTEKQEEIMDIVLEAQKVGITSIKPGVLASEVDKEVRNVITEYGYGENFIHSTGHGVGLEVHESPSLSKIEELKIEKNMVITVEPGIYLEGEFGIRIEDMVLVKNKARVLSNLESKISF